MTKRNVRFHSPLVIPISPNGRIFTGRYDSGYPFTRYRDTHNPLGGNPTVAERDSGKGPLDTLIREIREEIDPSAINTEQSWADSKDIQTVQEAILKNLAAFQDFYMQVPDLKEQGGRPAHNWIGSLYIAKVSNEIIDIVAENIKNGRRLLTEGYAGVTDINALESGRDKIAHSSGLILSYAFDRNIPCLATGATLKPIGMPRKSFSDYFPEFDYDPKAFRE